VRDDRHRVWQVDFGSDHRQRHHERTRQHVTRRSGTLSLGLRKLLDEVVMERGKAASESSK
jgi:hypothetical protein